MKTIDCRNMNCPAPVVSTKRALEETTDGAVRVLVDPGAPRENVTRFAVGRGYSVQEESFEDGFALTISGAKALSTDRPGNGISEKKTVYLVSTDSLGSGDDGLGRLLMKNFIITLLDLEDLPDRMLFLNAGIHLTTEGSEALEALEELGNRGVEILSCGVCLDFYHKKDKLRAGSVTNMFTIVESLMEAGSVIRL